MVDPASGTLKIPCNSSSEEMFPLLHLRCSLGRQDCLSALSTRRDPQTKGFIPIALRVQKMGEDRKSECCYSSLSYLVTFYYVACVGGGGVFFFFFFSKRNYQCCCDES